MDDQAQLAPLEPEENSPAGFPAEPVEEASPEHQFCVFRAGRERFCLPVLDVEEVVDWPLVTRLPLAPPYLLGIFNLRGSVVPLVDIAFTESRRPGLLPKQVVVASLRDPRAGEDVRIGIAADEVIGTHLISEPALLEAAPSDLPHCRGMLRHDDRLALALDLRRLIQVFPAPAM